MAQADLLGVLQIMEPPMTADHPSMIMVNNMMQAFRVRDAILDMLKKRKVRRLVDYQLRIDFALMDPDENTVSPVYGYNLRVFHRSNPNKKPVLSLWAETRDQLVNDENMLLLLMLYNS